MNYNEQLKKYKDRTSPVGLEEIVKPIGFDLPMDFSGNLLKNPIRPETASMNDYVILYEEKNESVVESKEEYLDDWMNG